MKHKEREKEQINFEQVKISFFFDSEILIFLNKALILVKFSFIVS